MCRRRGQGAQISNHAKAWVRGICYSLAGPRSRREVSVAPRLCGFKKLTSPYRRYVAVKVGLGSDIPCLNRETEILSQLYKTGQGKLGYQRVIKLFDVFIIEGPNGFHECLVTEVISPLSDPDARQQCSFEAVRQIIEGFAFLHEEGIVHGGKVHSVH